MKKDDTSVFKDREYSVQNSQLQEKQRQNRRSQRDQRGQRGKRGKEGRNDNDYDYNDEEEEEGEFANKLLKSGREKKNLYTVLSKEERLNDKKIIIDEILKTVEDPEQAEFMRHWLLEGAPPTNYSVKQLLDKLNSSNLNIIQKNTKVMYNKRARLKKKDQTVKQQPSFNIEHILTPPQLKSSDKGM